jgi:gas vesicle protein
MSNSSNTVVGLLAGTVIGATLGILFAPDKGINTRQKISEEALLAKDKLAERAAELKDQVTSTYTDQKGNLETQLESVMANVSYKADDVITTLEKKLAELKEKNKNLQKNKDIDLKNESSKQTV